MPLMDRQLEICYNKLESYFTKEYLEQFRAAPEDALVEYQSPLGTIIRIHMLGPKSALYRGLLGHGYASRSAMITHLIKGYHTWLQQN
jgi:hypothetical protein